MSDGTSKLADRITEVREARGLTARAWSIAAGLGPSHVGNIERGVREAPAHDTLYKLAGAAGVSLMWLSSGVGSMDAPDVPPKPTPRAPKQCRELAGWYDALAEASDVKPELGWAYWAIGELSVEQAHPPSSDEGLTGWWVLHKADVLSRQDPLPPEADRKRWDREWRAWRRAHRNSAVLPVAPPHKLG